jgi:hydroxymethylglutaryl-CoA lyase
MLTETAAYFYEAGIRNMPLSDILGEANPERIYQVYSTLIPQFPEVDFGLHLHTRPSDSFEKLEAAYEAGVRSFETVTNGLGGCPFAADELVGNLSTQDFISFCDHKNLPLHLDRVALEKAIRIANSL